MKIEHIDVRKALDNAKKLLELVRSILGKVGDILLGKVALELTQYFLRRNK